MSKINQDTIDFLLELQHELNTQDPICQADPRFWAIMDYKKEYGYEDRDEGWNVFDTRECRTIAESMEEICEYLKEYFADNINNVYRFEISKNPWGVDNVDIFEEFQQDQEPEWSIDTPDSFIEWMEEELGISDLIVLGYKTISFIAPNTFFLTHREAKNYLKRNAHHHSPNAHTYAMTAWRSPEVAKLWKILQETDWSELV